MRNETGSMADAHHPSFLTPHSCSGFFDHANHCQNQQGTDDRVQNVAHQPASQTDSDGSEQPRTDKTADDTHDDIAYQAKTKTLADLSGEPAADGSDDQDVNQFVCAHFLLKFRFWQNRRTNVDKLFFTKEFLVENVRIWKVKMLLLPTVSHFEKFKTRGIWRAVAELFEVVFDTFARLKTGEFGVKIQFFPCF